MIVKIGVAFTGMQPPKGKWKLLNPGEKDHTKRRWIRVG